MTVPSGTTQTYQAVGIREDLSDIIYDISPTDTPFMTMARRGNCDNTYPEWQTDSLAPANGDNAVIEGDDASNDTMSPTVRLKNYTQLMDKVVQVSSTQRAVNTAGRRDELSYQIAKRGKELKRDMETRLTGNYGSSAGSAGGARKSAGVEAWLETNTNRGSNGADGGYSAGTVSAATDDSAGGLRTFTESLLKGVIKSCWEEGGDPGVVMVGPSNKQVASGFGGIATLYRDTAGSNRPATIMGAADIYVSDYGEHRIVPNRFSRDRTALVLDMEFWEVKYLQPFTTEPLAKTGHSDRRMLSVEFTLASLNEKASGAVADLKTS